MQHLLNKIIDKEFSSNGMEVNCRVEPRAWQNNIVTSFQIKLLYRGGQTFMNIYCQAQRPYTPKLSPVNPIEPHKLIKLCEIIQEAFKELERKAGEGEDNFK